MEYKYDFANETKRYLKESVTVAEEFNEIWKQIEDYFSEIATLLEYERELLGDYIVFNIEPKVVEFVIRGNGLKFEKDVFSIRVQACRDNKAEVLQTIQYRDGAINLWDGSLNEYLSEHVEQYLVTRTSAESKTDYEAIKRAKYLLGRMW